MNEDNRARYESLLHAMQSGVAAKMNYAPGETTPKHLRVGVNAAMSDQGGLVKLLIAKGVITEAEYLDAITEMMAEEVHAYETELARLTGAKITLA